MIPIVEPSLENFNHAKSALAKGRLVSFPTETVYGLGANALDPHALSRIFEVKQRPFFDPLIIHIADRQALDTLCQAYDNRAIKLMDKFWPGPLTLVLKKTDAVPDLATSGLPSVAIRMPAHPVALELIKCCGFALAAPSANPFGRLSPTTANHVQSHFNEGIEMILEGGPCKVGLESTILSLLDETPVLLRAGAISKEEIEALIGPIYVSRSESDKPLAPGQLPGHYAPKTRLKILRESSITLADNNAIHFVDENHNIKKPRVGLLAFKNGLITREYTAIETLSPNGEIREAAANFFACLHKLDNLNLDWIEADPIMEIGLGVAIMDRLRKAAAGSGEL